MKPLIVFASTIFLVLCGCSTMQSAVTNNSETVMVTYHVQPGDEKAFQKILGDAWEVYRSEHMVFAQPHTLVRKTDDGGKTSFVEIFTWVRAPDHVHDTVKAIWKQEQSSCEKRDGKPGIEFSEVQLINTK